MESTQTHTCPVGNKSSSKKKKMHASWPFSNKQPITSHIKNDMPKDIIKDDSFSKNRVTAERHGFKREANPNRTQRVTAVGDIL